MGTNTPDESPLTANMLKGRTATHKGIKLAPLQTLTLPIPGPNKAQHMKLQNSLFSKFETIPREVKLTANKLCRSGCGL